MIMYWIHDMKIICDNVIEDYIYIIYIYIYNIAGIVIKLLY